MRKNKILLCTILLLLVISACKKQGIDPEPEPTEAGNFNKLIQVRNFGEALPENSEPLTEQSPIYYSLENNAATSLDYRRTNRWDISFSGVYRSFVGGNNGIETGNFGYGGPGKGGVLILEKAFEDVIDVPADNQFRIKSGIIGTDDAGSFGEGVGYYVYDFSGTLFNDGTFDNQHIAYCVTKEVTLNNGKKVVPRTIIIKTAAGNYAKIKMLSIYKDVLNPVDWKRNTPHPYFSFDYVLAKAGSTKFEIK
jgi:hypothetical protein